MNERDDRMALCNIEENGSPEDKELERARSMPITFDEDCPEVTPELAVRFRRVNPPRHLRDGGSF